MLHIYHGDGKGKTTAAFGLALRQIGHQKRVLIIQFLKQGDSGEMLALASSPYTTCYVDKSASKFYFQMNDDEKVKCKASQVSLWKSFIHEVTNADCVILDEILDVMNLGLLNEKEILTTLSEHKEHVEIILTGRNPSNALCALCDYESEIKMHKHPYQNGIKARIGVEF